MQINLTDLPSGSGIYAWYYQLNIGKSDIVSLSEEIDRSVSESEKKNLIRSFVNKYLFNFFKEEDYSVLLEGPLKAKYQGKIAHQVDISSSVIDKIHEDIGVLWEIRSALKTINYNFSSPLYIGMASNLAQRVNKHKDLIQKYRTEKVEATDSDNIDDHNFAARIVGRKFVETNLIVVLGNVPSAGSMHNIMENLMNRINYPILGRN